MLATTANSNNDDDEKREGRAAQIAAENLQIIQLTIQGLSDSEIVEKLGLTEANY
jgi:DNA-binding CsgD family transcriptional regulator